MKGISLDVIGMVIIALAGIVLLLMFVKTPLYNLARNAFCYFYGLVSDEPTEWCEPKQTLPEPIDIYPETREELARELGAYSIMCWEEATKPFQKMDIVCYQLFLRKHPGKIFEFDVTELLEREGGCLVLQNSLIVNETGDVVVYPGDCGVEDQLGWDVSGNVIENQSLILIKYDVDEKQIVIKA